MEKDIMVLGDIHGIWSPLNSLINKRKPEIMLQTGDFGWWPKFHNTNMFYGKNKKWDQYKLKLNGAKLYWCDGNHEDHWDLVENQHRNSYKGPVEVFKDVFYMHRGCTMKLKDGRNVMFIGGADSIDKGHRKLGLDWFPDEQISNIDIWNLPNEDVDIVISHTCPDEIMSDLWGSDKIMYSLWAPNPESDPSRLALSYVLSEYSPSMWFFSHFHIHKHGKFNKTRWWCLNDIPNTNWWMYLPD